jgi:hypothetical protein
MTGSLSDHQRLISETPFSVSHDTVFWQTAYGPAPLSEQNIEGLLDCWMEIGGPVSRKLWLDLYDAACRTSWFIKRPAIWRAEVAA